jgi:glyoxylase-like metal-dependent hydrolase (beta-lactamase superfamily II)
VSDLPDHVRDEGEGITRIAVPTPFAVGRVNCYLIDDDPLTLVDTGPNSGTSLVELEAGITAAGHRIEDLGRIVLTHQHIDHIGLARILAERSGAEVVALAALAPWLATYKDSMEAGDRFGEMVMLQNGFPEDLTVGMRAVTSSFRAWGSGVTVDRTIEDGDLLEFSGRSWRVYHRPGHSPSDTVFLDQETATMIGGDHLLQSISSNPLISRPLDSTGPPELVPRPPALLIYIASMQATAELDVARVLGGHGDTVTDHRGLIAGRLAGHERRANKIAALLEDGPLNAYEMAQKMWGNVAVTQGYLTLSEVLGHLDLLERDGRVRQIPGEIVKFIVA